MTATPSNPLRQVLVTGASGRLGRAIALRLAQDGFHVTAHCHRKVDEAQAALKAGTLPLPWKAVKL